MSICQNNTISIKLMSFLSSPPQARVTRCCSLYSFPAKLFPCSPSPPRVPQSANVVNSPQSEPQPAPRAPKAVRGGHPSSFAEGTAHQVRSLHLLGCDPIWGPLPPCGQKSPLSPRQSRVQGGERCEQPWGAHMGCRSFLEENPFSRGTSGQQSLGRWGQGGPSPCCCPLRVNRTNALNGVRKAVPELDPTWAQMQALQSHGKTPVYFGWSSVFVLHPYPSLVKCGAVLISRSPGT